MDWCILVDEQDREIGREEKLKTHQLGLLHRAFSVLIFNDSNEMLLQKRALTKYHSPGLWTNACCSHPQPDETVPEAGERRLMEEMGFSTELKEAFSFVYKADVGSGLTEHEFDHVMVGRYNAHGNYNLAEVSDARFVSLQELEEEITATPEQFTPWFRIIITQYGKKVSESLYSI
jgi:isopentenyl-diphosphate delta-isomerase